MALPFSWASFVKYIPFHHSIASFRSFPEKITSKIFCWKSPWNSLKQELEIVSPRIFYPMSSSPKLLPVLPHYGMWTFAMEISSQHPQDWGIRDLHFILLFKIFQDEWLEEKSNRVYMQVEMLHNIICFLKFKVTFEYYTLICKFIDFLFEQD